MKVLISWSGSRSRAVAEALHYWLKAVVQSIEPWMSEENIEKGTRWSAELTRELGETRIGIICLTPENLEAPWVLFEAGALTRTVEKEHVCPYLFGMEKEELSKGPLTQFQAAKADKADTKKLLVTINKAAGSPLTEGQLDDAFRRWWPDFARRLKRIPTEEELPERRMTMRGLPLGAAIGRVGLVDIENRDDFQYELPPNRFYDQAGKEIFITGPSLYMTFHKHIDLIHNALSKGRNICVAILHPDSGDVQWLTKRERRGIRDDIMATINTIKEEGLCSHPRFQIRFIQKLPYCNAVMIDGDISPKGAEPEDENGQIRVQPNTMYVTGHKGLIVQLKKIAATPRQPAGPFDYFAYDFRKQWENDARADESLFER